MAVDFITSFIVLFTGLFVVLERDTISAGLAGLSLSYALQVHTFSIHGYCQVRR